MQIFVYGDSLQAYLIAVVYPNKETAEQWAEAAGLGKPPLSEIITHAEYKKVILEEMNAKAKEAKLSGLERIKKLHLIDFPFTVENDLLTPTYKVKRNKAKNVFSKEIEEMYNEPME
mmetsp:Transcript_34596/g.25761  ORF Transcript_34596/g.25761 Transcript_34596/m.25761 type:complete len:117 (+) Transcript_34596:781-1131(+)